MLCGKNMEQIDRRYPDLAFWPTHFTPRLCYISITCFNPEEIPFWLNESKTRANKPLPPNVSITTLQVRYCEHYRLEPKHQHENFSYPARKVSVSSMSDVQLSNLISSAEEANSLISTDDGSEHRLVARLPSDLDHSFSCSLQPSASLSRWLCAYNYHQRL